MVKYDFSFGLSPTSNSFSGIFLVYFVLWQQPQSTALQLKSHLNLFPPFHLQLSLKISLDLIDKINKDGSCHFNVPQADPLQITVCVQSV